MTKITEFNRPNCRRAKALLNSILEQHADELAAIGVGVSIGHGSYSDTLLTYKLELGILGEGGKVATKAAEDFKRYSFEIDESIIEAFNNQTPFNISRERGQFIIAGYKPRSSKYPFVVQSVDNPDNQFKVSQTGLKMYLAHDFVGT